MTIDWATDTRDVDWQQLSELYRIAPLGNKNPDWLRTAYSNSLFKCLAFEDGDAIAAGRAVADGVDCSYLCDIVVHPDHQGRGFGAEVIRRLVAASAGHRKIILYAVPGKEAFYARFGFRKMRTAMAIFENPEKATEDGYLERV